MTQKVRLHVDGGVARITLCDVARRNAIGLAMAEAIKSAVTDASNMDGARVILIDAEGPYFSVGGDLREMLEAGDAIEARVAAIARPVNAALTALTLGPLPVVCAWSGMAAGGGGGFALCGDLVLAGRSARLTAGFTRSGLSPDTGLTWLLPRLLGHARAFAILALNPVIDAPTALGLGIANEIVEDDLLSARALDVARTLAAMPRHALCDTKRLLRKATNVPFAMQLDDEAGAISRNAAHPDTRRLLEAFFSR